MRKTCSASDVCVPRYVISVLARNDVIVLGKMTNVRPHRCGLMGLRPATVLLMWTSRKYWKAGKCHLLMSHEIASAVA